MQKLIRGIHHFQSSIFRSQQEFFQRLAKGQNPEVLFITCSDSRVNPNLVTHTDPGDLFILRNAGNIIPPYGATNGGEGATIELAVTGLGVKDIILCGHSHCSAMQSLLDLPSLKDMPLLADWLAHAETTRRIMLEKYCDRVGGALLTTTVEENVLMQIENLRTHPAVATALAAGRLKLHGWVYKIETGEIFAYDPTRGQYVPIAEATADPTECACPNCSSDAGDAVEET